MLLKAKFHYAIFVLVFVSRDLELGEVKKLPNTRHLGTIAQLCQAIALQLGTYRQSEKNLLNSNTSPRPYNMVNLAH